MSPSKDNRGQRQNTQHLPNCNPLKYLMILVIVTTAVSFLYAVASSLDSAEGEWKSTRTGNNLLLTPFIQNGELGEARELAKVDLFPGIESYSGFLTVDEECGSNLFFWFFPAASGNVSAPLILWHGGGPGTSALFALFHGTGPIAVNENADSWTKNMYSWTEYSSVLYLDSPVGSGFSYTEKGEACYASSSDDVAEGVVTALRQFFQLFPEYQQSDFYISTSSYGGKFIPVIGRRIDLENELDSLNGLTNSTGSVKLKGLVSISGFSDPIHQIDYGEFYFNMGFINENQMKHFKQEETRAKAYIRSKDYYSAFEIIDPLVVGTAETSSYLRNASGVDHPYNFHEDLANPFSEWSMHRLNKLLNLEWVQKAIHVSRQNFSVSSNTVYKALARDIYKSVRGEIEDLLDKGYRFLFTVGQFDLIVPHTTILKFLTELRWDGGRKFRSLGHYWYRYHRGGIAGYGKSTGNLTYVMLRNVGHHPFIDEPGWTQDLIYRFILQLNFF